MKETKPGQVSSDASIATACFIFAVGDSLKATTSENRNKLQHKLKLFFIFAEKHKGSSPRDRGGRFGRVTSASTLSTLTFHFLNF
jgi:hypothetical protein